MQINATPGMIGVGVANIVLASIGLAAALIVGATVAIIPLIGLATGHPLRIPEHISESFGGLVVTEHNVLWILCGALCIVALSAALDVLLFVSGLLMLGRSPSGRTYSLVWAALALCAGAIDAGLIVLRWHEGWPLSLAFVCLTPAYALLLIALFRRPAWRRAFAG
jgi:hypothetical protein